MLALSWASVNPLETRRLSIGAFANWVRVFGFKSRSDHWLRDLSAVVPNSTTLQFLSKSTGFLLPVQFLKTRLHFQLLTLNTSSRKYHSNKSLQPVKCDKSNSHSNWSWYVRHSCEEMTRKCLHTRSVHLPYAWMRPCNTCWVNRRTEFERATRA